MEQELEPQRDLELRLLNVFTDDINTRVKDLTYLVALQESELAMMWLTIIGLVTYIIVKEHNVR
jgi:hypothetical protein